MTSLIGGYDTGLLDSSLFQLNRDDRTREGREGHGEDVYVNVANGNLILQHKDAYLPSQGEDFFLVRTYNSRGTWSGNEGQGWSNNATELELSQISTKVITLVNADSSRSKFYQVEGSTTKYVSVDGAGAYQELTYDAKAKRYFLTRADQTVLTFDVNGTLLSSRDTNGNLIEFQYAKGKLTSLKDDKGHVITYVYTGAELTQVKDETGTVLVSYEYAKGRLISVTDRAGHVTRYTYTTDGEVASVTLPANAGEQQRTISFQYDPNPIDNTGKSKLLRWLTDAEGNRTYFEYKFNVDNFNKYNGGQTIVVNALGINRRESNAAEYVEWRLANGYYAQWDAGRYAADAAYQAQADAITSRHTVTYGYDANGEIISVTDQVGYRTTYQYDAKENLTAVTDANGFAITHSDDAYWRDLRRDYGMVDAGGQGKLVTDLTQAEVSSLLERYTTHLEYDTHGNLTKRTDNADNVTTYVYTGFNKLASKTAAMGNALVGSDEASVQEKRVELGYAREAANLSASDKAALLALYTTTYSYDGNQNLVEVRSPGGDLTRFEYDQYGNLTKKTAYLDSADLNDPSKRQVTRYFYDAYGQNVKTIDAEGYATYNTFDHFGNRTSHTDANGGVTRYTYDADDRLLTVTDPEGYVTAYTYDAVGNRTAVRDANGHSVLYFYDRNNMLLTVIDPKNGDAAGDRITRYDYDVVGNRTQVADAEGRVSTYLYREDRRLLEVRTPTVTGADGTSSVEYTTRYEYDGLGNRIAVTDRNGNRTQYVYNEDSLLKKTTDAIGNVTEYRYDANLNQIQIVIGAQLSQEKRRVLRFGYDEEDQRIQEIDALAGVTRYARDAVGNVLSVTDANGHATEFSYDKNNRLLKETRPAVADPVTGQLVRHTVQHQYDGNGNQVAVVDENGHASRYTFDQDNRLVMVEDANGVKTVYGYDSRHNKTSVSIGVQAHVDVKGRVVVDSIQDARVESYTYDEFNQITAKTDGMGNALVSSDSAMYRTLRQEMGYAAAVADLSAADRQAILAAYTERYTYDKVGNLKTTTDHLGRITGYDYDSLNRQVTRTDALGNVTRYRYDGNGNRVAVTDALGRTTTNVYDGVNRLVSSTDALGITATRDYDNVGNLLAETRAANTADARTTRYEYDLNNRLTRQIDGEGIPQSYVYDAVGNRLQAVDGRGNASRYVYDARNRLVKTIDPMGFETRVEYDGVGNRVALIDARGGITRFEYDPGNRLLATTDAEGRVTRFEYDVRGNRITQRTAAGTPVEEVTHFEYDAENNLRAVVDAEGNRSSSAFDRVYNRISATDANGHTTTYAFDALNRMVEVVDPAGGHTRYAFDAVGNTLSRTDALGRVTRWDYDADNRQIAETDALGVVTQYAYDAVHNRIEVVRAAGTGEAQHTVYQYDKNNRLVAQTDALGYTATHEYDGNGNVVRTADPLGRATTYRYDADNRLTHITDPLGYVTEYRYDAVGNRVQVVDPLGSVTTSYYNLNRELVLAVDPEGSAVAYAYDANGNRVSQTRYAHTVTGPLSPSALPNLVEGAGDEVTRYDYDRLNRLVRTLDPEGYVVDTEYDAVGNVVAARAYANQIVFDATLSLDAQTPVAGSKDRLNRFTYDANDRLVKSIDAEGYTTARTYDAVGNELSRTLFLDKADFSNPLLQQTVRYAYDGVNRLVAQTDPLGVQSLYAYDAVSNRTALTEAAGTADERTTRYVYDLNNRPVEDINAEGTVTRREFDGAGQLIRETRAFGRPEARVTENRYDADGRLIEQVGPDGTLTRWTYDALGNVLVRTDAAGTPDERLTTYQYDRNRRLVSEILAYGTAAAIQRTYAYDAFGNSTEAVVGAGTPDARVMRYAYDHNNRLIAEQDGNGIVRLHDYDAFGNRLSTSLTGTTLSAAGNEIALTEVETFEYDGRNLLVRQQNGAHETVLRSYDAAGNLRFQTAGAGTAAAAVTEFRYDLGNRLIAKVVDPSGLELTTRYTYDQRGNLVAETDANGYTSRTRFDLMNRALAVTNGEGFTTSFEYDRFGNQTAIITGQYLVASNDPAYDADKATRAMPATTRFAYDANDQVVFQADALGVVTKYGYDARGNRTEKIDAYGRLAAGQSLQEGSISVLPFDTQRIDRFRYDHADRLVDEIQPAGSVVHYAYNGAGELSAKTLDFGGRNATTRYFYDAGGRVIFEADPLGTVTRYQYDDFGNRVRTIRGLALGADGRPSTAPTSAMRVTAMEYDAANRLTAEVVDPDGLALRTAYEYDARSNRTAVVEANGARSEIRFDAADRAVWTRDAEGYVTTVRYDGNGNRIGQTSYATRADSLPAGGVPSASQADRTATFAYDAVGHLVEATDARGVIARFTYDATGNLLKKAENATGLYGSAPRVTTYTFNATNLVASQTDPSGQVTHFDYDPVYNLAEKRVENRWLDTLNTDAAGKPVERVEVQVTRYGYDLNNRLTDEITDPDGLNLHKAYRYDGLGNRIAEIDPNGMAAAGSDAPWALAARRELGIVDANGVAIPAAQLTAEQRQQVLDAFTARTWFDTAGRQVAQADRNGFVSRNEYDAVGNLVRTTRFATALSVAQLAALGPDTPPTVGADAADRSVDHVFDKADREIETRLSGARLFVNGAWHDNHETTTEKAYDAVGNVVREKDGNGYTTYHYFDRNRREIGKLDAEGYLSVDVLDAFGDKIEERVYLEKPALSASEKAALDLAGYVPAGEARVILNEYDAGGNAVRTVYPQADLYLAGVASRQATSVERQFDAFGQLLSETVRHALSDTSAPATRYTYDGAGRLVEKVDARADEALAGDSAAQRQLRRALGIVDGTGAGKAAAALTDADRAAIRAAFTTTFAYDGAGNLRDRNEAGRLTTYEYDKASRATRIHFPATEAFTVTAQGTLVGTTARAIGGFEYDADGNTLREVKADGDEVRYRYDRAGHRIAALNQGVYVAYGVNFAGDSVSVRRFATPANDIFAPPAAGGQDQYIAYTVDRLGHVVEEHQFGNQADLNDDRIIKFGYDANGNQVQIIDGRNNVSQMFFDGLNRQVGTVNPAGGKTHTVFDALGNVVARQTGAFDAPSLVGGIKQSQVTDRGVLLEWTTSLPADGRVYVRRAGTAEAWQIHGLSGHFATDHAAAVTGLAPSTDYEYYVESRDAFGHALTTAIGNLRSAAGIGSAVVDGVAQTAGGWQATLHFTVPAGAQNVEVVVGLPGSDPLALDGESRIAATLQADGSYAATLAFANADAQFQVVWTDAEGRHISGAQPIQQRVETRRFDGSIKATASGSAYDLTVNWNLADALAAGDLQAYTDADGETRYRVYAGYVPTDASGNPVLGDDGQPLPPNYTEATLKDGLFTVNFNGVADGPRTVYFRYLRPDGSEVLSAPVPVAGLANLDVRAQRLEFAFPDVDLAGTKLEMRYRKAGQSAWTLLPESAVSGLSVNLLGLSKGEYEYEANLVANGAVLRTASGSLSLKTPGGVSGLKDAVNAGAVDYTLEGETLSFPSLLPLTAEDTLTVTLTDGTGATVEVPVNGAELQLGSLASGRYDLHLVKTRTVTVTTPVLDAQGKPVLNPDGTPKVTVTTRTTVLADIDGKITIAPLTLTGAQAHSLAGSRSLTSYALDRGGEAMLAATVTTTGEKSGDHTWTYYDANGWKTYSNEEGGVWTRYFHDAQGNITREVRFKRRGDDGKFVNAIQDTAERPSLAALEADYAAALAAPAADDAIRVLERRYDAAGNVLEETRISQAYGTVTERSSFDLFKNRILQVSAAGITGQESTLRTVYDGLNRVVKTETGPFDHFDEAGNRVRRAAVETFAYDVRGNKVGHTDARNNTERYSYDAYNRVVSHWDAAGALRTDYAYDSFGRVVSQKANDLTGRASVAMEETTFTYDGFDQVASFTDALGRTTRRSYDAGGNLVAETNALGHAEHFVFDAENRVLARTDRLGHVSRWSYDAYGHLTSESDANGRVITYELGAFGQTLSKNISLTRPQTYPGGAQSAWEKTRYDWLGRSVEVTDSFGKHQQSTYDDGDRLVQVQDFTLGQTAKYGYDTRGNRVSSALFKGSTVLRVQTQAYNEMGWLTGVSAQAGFELGGATIAQNVDFSYQFDAVGNRVQVDGNTYRYDAAGHMIEAYDGKTRQRVSAVGYDGYGNRISATEGGTTTTYTYNAGNQVISSSAGESWQYDTLGNVTFQRNRDGSTTSTTYNAESRAVTTVSRDGSSGTTSTNTYDAVGNVIKVRVDGSNYGFDEITSRDIRYLETSKVVANSWAEGAERLDGATSFTYDGNGNLTLLNRGNKQGASQATIVSFAYDLDGHIIGKGDRATLSTDANYFQGFESDPATTGAWNAYGGGISALGLLQSKLLGRSGATETTTHLTSYLYADTHPVAEANGEHQLRLKSLTLTDTARVIYGDVVDESGVASPIEHRLALVAGDIVTRTDGTVDRAATARKIAERAYSGLSGLSGAAQQKVVNYVQGQLPADSTLLNLDPGMPPWRPGTEISLYGHIQLMDSQFVPGAEITDYSYRQIGATVPGGSLSTHVVKGGDTLQSLAAVYYGSPAYWYLIAEANGLTGSEALAAGTTLTIPSAVANSANTAETFKVYNESEVIGSTSPEIRTIQKPKKKKKWYQKLVQILVIVIMVVAVIVTAGAAMAAMGMAAPALGTLGAMGASFAGSLGMGVAAGLSTGAALVASAAMGAMIFAGASILTQGLQMAAGLQEKFSWKAVAQAAKSGAISGLTAAAGAGLNSVTQAGSAARIAGSVAIAAGGQLLQNGRITNVAGLVGAAVGAGAFGADLAKYSGTATAGLSILEKTVRGKGVNAMDWVGLATSAAFDSQRPDSMETISSAEANKLAWQSVAISVIGAAVVGSQKGWDAGLASLQGTLGEGLGYFGAGRKESSEVMPKFGQLGSGTYGLDGDLGTGFLLVDPSAPRQQDSSAPYDQLGSGTYGSDANMGSGFMTLDPTQPLPATVRAGDYGGSLERVARAQLGPNATQREINNYVGQLFEINNITNARRIGPDREILLPDVNTPAATVGIERYGRDIVIGENLKAAEAAAARQAASMNKPETLDLLAPGGVCTRDNPIGLTQGELREAQAYYAGGSLSGISRNDLSSAQEAYLNSFAREDFDRQLAANRGPQMRAWDGKTKVLPSQAEIASNSAEQGFIESSASTAEKVFSTTDSALNLYGKRDAAMILDRAGRLNATQARAVGAASSLTDAAEVFKSPSGKSAEALVAASKSIGPWAARAGVVGQVAGVVEETAYIMRTPEDKRLLATGAAVTNVALDTGTTYAGAKIGAGVGFFIGGPIGAAVGGFIGGVGAHFAYDEFAKGQVRYQWTGIPEKK